MSGASAGYISLDLIIKSKLEDQLEKIKSSIRSLAKKSENKLINLFLKVQTV